jgi:hypothetical protein
MRISYASALLFITPLLCFCSKDKPSSPPPPTHTVTLRYQSYYPFNGYYWGCIRLTLRGITTDRCGLGSVYGGQFETGDYEWKLYVIDNSGPEDRYYIAQIDTVLIDRSITCNVNGASVTWR